LAGFLKNGRIADLPELERKSGTTLVVSYYCHYDHYMMMMLGELIDLLW